MKNRVLSMLLAIVMVVGLLPAAALAADGDAECAHSYEGGYYLSDEAYHYPMCDICEDVDESVKEEHSDDVNDRYCDICGEYLSKLCTDADEDLVCDTCATVMSWLCEDKNPVDHLCDNEKCTYTISECADTQGNDNVCDICGKGIYPHADALNVEVTPGDGEMVVTWAALEAVGTDTVASYTVYCAPEDDIENRREAVYPTDEAVPFTHTFIGLTAGVTYEVGVCATYTEEGEYGIFEAEQSTLEAFYDLWVGGVQVTSANADDVLEDSTVSFSVDEFFEENILTLDSANITAGYEHDDGAVAAIYSNVDLNIELVGTENRITAPDARSSSGIWAESLTISGEEGSSLTVSGGSAAASGKYAESVGISVSGGISVYKTKVTAMGGSATVTGDGKAYSNGIFTEGNVMVDFGGQLIGRGGEASGASAFSTGMDAYGEEDAYINVAVYDDSILELTGGTASASVEYAGSNGLYGSRAGLYVYGINSHTVLKGGEAQAFGETEDSYAYSNGIMLGGGDVSIENGTVVITSGQWSGLYGDGYALYAAAEEQTEDGFTYTSGGSVDISCENIRQSTNPTSPLGTRVTITSETGAAIYAETGLDVGEMLAISTPEGASVQGIGGCNDPENWADPDYWTIVDAEGAKAQSISVEPLLYIVDVRGLDSSACIWIPAGQTVNQVVCELYASAGVTDFLEVLKRMNPDAEWTSFGGWYTDEACTAGNEYDFDTPADEDITIYPKWVKKSSGGGGGSPNTTKTQKNEDGSTTTTTTNKATGTVTETTKNPDGTTGTVVTDKKGNITGVSAKVPADAVKNAEQSGETVKLPIEIEAANDTDKAVEIEVDVPNGGATVEIPVENVTSGTVIITVNADGTEKVVKTSTVSDTGVVVTLEKDTTIKAIDNSKYFMDVHPVDHWAEEAVDFVVARGIYSGTSATTFHPDNSMTRGMLAVVLHNLEDNPGHAFDGVFHDVAEDSWYENAIHWAADNGIVSGYGNGQYGPNDSITREQLAVMLWRYAGSPDSDHSLAHFTDAHQIVDYAKTALAWANENDIISGKGGGILDPQGIATRAQAVQMLMNYLKNVL